MSALWVKDAGIMTYRVFGVVIGGYALWTGIVPLFGLALHGFGLPLAEGMLISSMLGVLVYIGVLIWGFAAPLKMRPASVILFLGAIAMLAAAQLAPAEIGA